MQDSPDGPHFSLIEFFNKKTVMQQRLFMFLLFTGIFPFMLSVKKYYLIKQLKTWNDSLAFCKAQYSNLATIESNDDILQLQSLAQSDQTASSSGAWIGLHLDNNSWHWSFKNTPLGTTKFWKSQEPDNNAKDEECALINSGEWSDESCTDPNPFICFDDSKTGPGRYIYNATKITWPSAQSYCRLKYTDLASAMDSTENGALQSLASGDIWFGLFRDSWKWIDQTDVSSIQWKSGQPDITGSVEGCGIFRNSQMEDELCSTKMFFFCHDDYTETIEQKQIIRVKVQTKQDANEPEVKAAILEKIKKKLMENGVAENTTVMWRMQPHGEVFYKENRMLG